MPGEVQQNLDDAEADELTGLPEAQKQEYYSNLERGTAFGLSQLSSRNAGLAGVAAVNDNQNDAYANMLSQDSAVRDMKKQRVYAMRGEVAGYRDKEFEYNVSNPYYEGIARRQARTAALFQNLNNAASMGMGGMGKGGGKSQSGGGESQMYGGPDGNEYSQYGSYA